MHSRDTFDELEKNKDVTGLYSLAKRQMGWKAATTPSALRLEDRMIRKPGEIANVQLKHFSDKIKKNSLQSYQE